MLNIIVKHCSEWLTTVPSAEVNRSSGKCSDIRSRRVCERHGEDNVLDVSEC